MKKSTRKEYELRINRAIDYIAENLTNPLNLQEISEAASFSPYHFHRIFKAITGETINSFVNRVRCAKSACLLVYNDDCSLSEIALMSGFSSSAAFSRSFREYFAVTPSEYRSGGWKKISKICKNESKNWKDFLSIRPYSVGVFDEPSRRRWKEMKVEIKTLPDYRVAYMRHIGPYGPGGIQETWKKLGNWMLGRDLWKESSVMLGISHDDPHIVPAEKCRYDACVVIDEDYETGNSVNTTEIKGGKYAVYKFKGSVMDIGKTWEELYAAWLPDSGFAPGEGPAFEIYRGLQEGKDPSDFECDICIPIKPL